MTTIKKPGAKTSDTDPLHWMSEGMPPALFKASCEGLSAVTAVFARGGSGLWLSGRVIEVGRDEGGGDIWLRTHNDRELFVTEHAVTASDLATLAGMLMAAAIIQAHNEETNP